MKSTLMALAAAALLGAAGQPLEIGKVGDRPITMDNLAIAMMHQDGEESTFGPGWLTPLLDLVEGRLMEIEASARGVEVTDDDVDLFLRFGEDPLALEVYQAYVDIFGSDSVLDYYRMVLTKRKMKQEVLRDELLEIYDQAPTDEEMLAFFVEHQRDIPFTEPQEDRLAVILLDDATSASEVESLLLAGEPFDAVALAWSIDEASRVNGGDVGRGLTPRQIAVSFPPSMVPQIAATEVGSWTGPHAVENIGATRILFVNVIERKPEIEHSYEDMKDTVRDILVEMRVPELYEMWAAGRLGHHGVSFTYDLFTPVADDLLGEPFVPELTGAPEGPEAAADTDG